MFSTITGFEATNVLPFNFLTLPAPEDFASTNNLKSRFKIDQNAEMEAENPPFFNFSIYTKSQKQENSKNHKVGRNGT